MKNIYFRPEKDLKRLEKATDRIKYLQERIKKTEKEIANIRDNNKINGYNLEGFDDKELKRINELIRILKG